MKVFSPVVCGRFAASCLTLFAAVAMGLPSFAENVTYTWTASNGGMGSSDYVKIFDDVGTFNGRLRLAGFSTADGEYTITSNRLHALGTAASAMGELPAGAYTYQMSCGARFDGTTTKSIRVQLAQPANSSALYARITAIATANGDHTDVPDLRVAIKDDHTVDGTCSEASADLLANAVTRIVVEVKPPEAIAYWPFGENGFRDVSGNGHDLVGVEIAENDAAYVTLNQGRTDQYLKTAAALDLSGETAVTFECWCRLTDRPAGTYNIPFASANPGTGTGGFVVYNSGIIYQAQMRAATDGWQLDCTYTNDGVNVTQSLKPGTYVDGAWHHIAYVIDRSRVNDHYSCRLYIDGVLQRNGGKTGSATYTVPQLFNDFFVIGGGANYVAGKEYFRGYIDDVRISRGVVAPADFLKYPTVGKKMRADDDKLPVVAYWPFGGNGCRDVTDNGYDLVTSNVAFKSGYALTTWASRKTQFACSVNQTFPFSAFSKIGFTLEMFVKSDSSSTILGMLAETGSGYWNNPGAFRISFDDKSVGYSTIFSGFHVSGGYGVYSRTSEESFGDLGDAKWRHLAMVYDPAKRGAGIVTMYIDGIPAACSTEAGNTDQKAFALSDLPLYLFRRENRQVGDTDSTKESTACPYYGSLDDVRITAAALTPDKFLVARSLSKKAVAVYRFDQSRTDDVTGNGHSLTFAATPQLATDSTFSTAGIGLKMNGSSQRFYTTDPIDLTHTKAMTIEFDYNRYWKDPAGPYALAASEDIALAGGFLIDRRGENDDYRGFFRAVAGSDWASSLASGSRGTAVDGRFRVRYSIDANTVPASFTLCVDGTIVKTGTATTPIDNLGSQRIYFGNSPSYQPTKYFRGNYYRIAISDEALDPADYVLDNLDNAIGPEDKQTLAYWDFSSLDGVSAEGVRRIGKSLQFDGTCDATTTNLTLAALTQVTVECFVRFGLDPASGTIFGLGSGAGSFAVSSDATAGTLAGSFIPYDHLAASNGGTADLAAVADRSWHHVALVIDRTKTGADAVRFYVDYQRTMPAGRAWDKAATVIDGVLTVGAGFTGRIDDLRVSAGALAPNEFLQSSQLTAVPIGTSISVR